MCVSVCVFVCVCVCVCVYVCVCVCVCVCERERERERERGYQATKGMEGWSTCRGEVYSVATERVSCITRRAVSRQRK